MEKAPLFIREASGAPLNQQLLPLGPAPPSTLVIRLSHTGSVVVPAPPCTLTSLFLPQGLCTACLSAATRPPSLPSLTPLFPSAPSPASLPSMAHLSVIGFCCWNVGSSRTRLLLPSRHLPDRWEGRREGGRVGRKEGVRPGPAP